MNKEILKYIEDGITIDGNPKDGYTVFTIITQHFKCQSLDDLTPERFELAISDLSKREAYSNDAMSSLFYNNIDFSGYVNGRYE